MGTFTQTTATNLTNPDQSYLVLSGQEKRLSVEFIDVNNVDYDPVELSLSIYSPDGSILLNETYSVTSPNIKRSAAGKYHIDFTPTLYGSNTGDYPFVWAWRDTVGGEKFNGFQTIFLSPIQVFSAFPYLRNQIDKAQKELATFSNAINIFSYTDVQMYMAIKGGLSNINRTPPQTNLTFINFPWNLHQQLVIDVATFVALESQGLCAIDTDANYSMQGNSFTVDHWSKISAYLSMLSARINQHLGQFKLNYMLRGAVKVERGPGFRQVSVFQAAPSGISFGNTLGVR